MNATSRTLAFVGVAAIAAVSAMGIRYANRPAAVDGFSDVGQEFFAEFRDPLRATELSVLKFDADAKDPLSFLVKQNDKGLWVIPSHHDYPAEAAQRLAKTAASLIGIRKVALQSRSKDDWARYGVEDPSAEVAVDATAKETGKDQSRGTRITLRDSSGNGLVDLIVGKPVPGREKHFYVRQPEKNPVFIAQLDADLSAKFSDWIEPDLLKINQTDIVKVVVDQYSVDEEQGAILQGEKLEFSKDKTANKWSMTDLDPITESLKESAITDVTSNLDQLKIVGVRPKPEGLNPDLTVSREVAQNPLLRQVLQADMQRQGFYIARGENDDVKLVSNEGELIAGTSSGVRYTLYFGEIARGTAKDIETGLNDPRPAVGETKPADGEATPAEGETKAEGTEDKPPETPAPEEKSDSPESGPRRYLLVKVDYDESLLGPPPLEPVAPEKPAILNEGAVPSAEKPSDPPKDDAPKPDAPAEDAPKEDAPPADAPKEESPREEEKAQEPGADTPAPAAPPESKSETPADPGSCDEPTAADPPSTEPAKEAPAQETPADAAIPAAQETPAAAATADETAPAKEDAAAPAKSDDPAAPPTDPNAPAVVPTAEPQPPADPRAEAQKAYDQALGDYEAAKAGHQSALKSWEDRTKEGKKKVDELSTRFGTWYYVISADSFEKFKLSRAAVVEPKKESKPEDAALPGAGAIPNFDLPGPGK